MSYVSTCAEFFGCSQIQWNNKTRRKDAGEDEEAGRKTRRKQKSWPKNESLGWWNILIWPDVWQNETFKTGEMGELKKTLYF